MGLLNELDQVIAESKELLEADAKKRMEEIEENKLVKVIHPSDEPEKEPEVVIQDGIALGGFDMPKGVY